MKPILSSLIIILFLGSCSPSEEYMEELIRIQASAIEGLEGQAKYKIHEMNRSALENPQKYGDINRIIKAVDDRYQALKKDPNISKKKYLSFRKYVEDIIMYDLVNPNYKPRNSINDDFYKNDDLVTKSSLLMSAAVLMDSFTNLVFVELEGCGRWFASLEDYPIGFIDNHYSFALLSNKIQQLNNKNYQIDSVLFNGETRHLQNEILPAVCSNITIQSEKPGNYQIYGHMDYMYGKSISSIPFEHSFTKK